MLGRTTISSPSRHVYAPASRRIRWKGPMSRRCSSRCLPPSYFSPDSVTSRAQSPMEKTDSTPRSNAGRPDVEALRRKRDHDASLSYRDNLHRPFGAPPRAPGMLRECDRSSRRARHTPPRDSILSSGPSRAPAPYRCRPSWWDAAPTSNTVGHISQRVEISQCEIRLDANPLRRRSLHRPPPYTRTFRARNGRHRKKPPDQSAFEFDFLIHISTFLRERCYNSTAMRAGRSRGICSHEESPGF